MRRSLKAAVLTALVLMGVSVGAVRATAGEPARRAPVIAVFPLQPDGANAVESSVATDRLREELVATGKFTVMEPARVEAVLNEQVFQQTGCVALECAVRVGLVLQVSKSVVGTLLHSGTDHWELSLSVIDVASNQVESNVAAQFEGTLFGLMSQAIPVLATSLAGTPPPRDAEVQVVSPDQLRSARHEPVPEHPPVMVRGLGVFMTYVNYTGDAHLRGGGGTRYTGEGAIFNGVLPGVGVDYFWSLGGPWALGAFLALGWGGAPHSDLIRGYDVSSLAPLGVELRYWTARHWYVGAHLFDTNTTLSSRSVHNNSGDLVLSGAGWGATGGYQLSNGWFIGLGLDEVSLTADASAQKGAGPKVTRASEADGWLYLGYRWGHAED